jgi:hypothetical protein
MNLEESDELLGISESKAIALGADVTFPCTSDREAGKPSHDGESQTPYADNREKDKTCPSHSSRLEDAQELHEKSKFDNGSLHKVYAVLNVEILQPGQTMSKSKIRYVLPSSTSRYLNLRDTACVFRAHVQ